MARIASRYFGFLETPARAIIPVSPAPWIHPVAGCLLGLASCQSAARSIVERIADGASSEPRVSAAEHCRATPNDANPYAIGRKGRLQRQGFGIFKTGAVPEGPWRAESIHAWHGDRVNSCVARFSLPTPRIDRK